MIGIVVAVLLQAGQVSAVSTDTASSVWGRAEVDAYIEANMPSSTSATDPFAVPPQAPAPASLIKLSASLSRWATGDADADPVDAEWKYEVETQTLTLKATPENAVSMVITAGGSERTLDRTSPFQVWPTSKSTERSDGGSASNAFGATVDVTNVHEESRAITQLGRRFSDRPGPPFSEQYGRSYKWTMTIAPEEARALVERLRFEVVAEPVAYAPGKWVTCGLGGSSATMDAPISLSERACFLTVRVSAVRFVDSGDGRVIHEWTAEP